MKNMENEVKNNREKILNEEHTIKPNGGYDFNAKNLERTEKVKKSKENNTNKILNYLQQHKVLLIVNIVVVVLLLLVYNTISNIYTIKIQNQSNVPSVGTQNLTKSMVLSGKDVHGITINVNDARINNNEVQIQFTIQNKSKNYYYPVISRSQLFDSNNTQYKLAGVVMPNIADGIAPNSSINGLFMFNIEGNNPKNFTLSVFGSDIEHFTFTHDISFTIK